MKPMEKIILAERQANDVIEEAKIYQTTLIEKTKKKSLEKASELLALAKKEKEEIEIETKKVLTKNEEDFRLELKKEETKLLKSITKKKSELVELIIKEVKNRDR